MNLVSVKIKVLKFSVRELSSPFGPTYTTWNRGWYLCIEFRIICKCKAGRYVRSVVDLESARGANFVFCHFVFEKRTWK